MAFNTQPSGHFVQPLVVFRRFYLGKTHIAFITIAANLIPVLVYINSFNIGIRLASKFVHKAEQLSLLSSALWSSRDGALGTKGKPGDPFCIIQGPNFW